MAKARMQGAFIRSFEKLCASPDGGGVLLSICANPKNKLKRNSSASIANPKTRLFAPRDMVVRMNEVLVKGLREKEVLDRFAAIGAEVLPTTPEEFAAFIRAEHARWGEVIRRAGIKVEQ